MRIALAYSGGLDTSVIIPWLKEHYGAEVFAVIVNVGQKDDFPRLRQKALDSGASDVWIPDCRAEFLESYAFPIVSAEARYEGQYLLGTAIARPLIAAKLVEGAARWCHLRQWCLIVPPRQCCPRARRLNEHVPGAPSRPKDFAPARARGTLPATDA